MAAILRDVLVVVVVGRTRQRSMPLAIMTIQKKKRMGLDFYVYMRSCFYSYGAFAPLIIETPQKITPTFTIFVQHGVTTHVL